MKKRVFFFARLCVFTAWTMEVTVIWGMTPCSLIEVLMSVRPHIQTIVIFRSFLGV